MTSWRKTVEEYVELRRSLGFKLVDAKIGLIKFASFLQQRRALRITIPLAMEWAQQDKTARPAEWRSGSVLYAALLATGALMTQNGGAAIRLAASPARAGASVFVQQ